MHRLLFFFAFFLLLFSCTNKNETKKEQNKPIIFVSISPYHKLIKKIVGDSLNVRLLISPSHSPHHFEPTLKQLHDISNANIWFCIGEFFEKKLQEVLKKIPSLEVIDITQDIDLLYYDKKKHCDFKDVHVWMSPKRIKFQMEKITNILIKKFPENQKFYEKNLNTLSQKLIKLDEEIQTSLQKILNKTILISHPSLSYFCHDYNLEQLTPEKNNFHINPQYLSEILNLAKEKNILATFVQPQHNNQAVQFIAKKINSPLHVIDPFNPNYFTNIRKIVKILEEQQHLKDCNETCD